MVLAVYGGFFNPPHLGHLAAARAAISEICPDKLIIIPAAVPPHKPVSDDTPSDELRLSMARLAFSDISCAEVSDAEICRGGVSFTADTIRTLLAEYENAEIYLFVGTDMFESFEKWANYRWILEHVTLATFPREEGQADAAARHAEHLRQRYGARVAEICTQPMPMSSSEIRLELKNAQGRQFLPEALYAFIIKNRLYGARPSLAWLRERAEEMLLPKRIPHVLSCERAAVSLARRWGASEYEAAAAAILHDITKKLDREEQLKLCEKYDIIIGNVEHASDKLLHAKTGAAISRDIFGASDDVYSAIKWHTTGRAGMALLEKIIYMADYIEETRNFEGVEGLRALAYENLDAAMALGLSMSIKEIEQRKIIPHKDTLAALEWYKGAVT